jgi:hypothetical protein
MGTSSYNVHWESVRLQVVTSIITSHYIPSGPNRETKTSHWSLLMLLVLEELVILLLLGVRKTVMELVIYKNGRFTEVEMEITQYFGHVGIGVGYR